MSDKSNSEKELFDIDRDSADDKDDDVADPEVPLRDEDDDDNGDDADATGPLPGESEADAGYGGEENYAQEEQGENLDERDDYDDRRKIRDEGDEEPAEEDVMDMVYTKDEDDDIQPYDFEEDDGDRGDKKKSKRDKSEKSKKRKKVKRDYEGEEAEEDPDAEERENRPRKGKKNKKNEEEVNEEELDNLISEMETAYDEDIYCFKNKQPAINKLKLLNKVEAVLKRGAYQRAFIDLQHNGLDILAKWLTKLPGGAPPSMQLKKRLVDIIFQLPVSDEHLKNSDIGKVLYGMRSNPAEDADLKKMLKDIIDKWTRLITDMANEYNNTSEDIRDRKKIDISLDDYRQRSMSNLRRSIPKLNMKKSGFDFVRKPQTEGGSMRALNARQQANEECDKLIKDMKRRMKKDFK